MAKKSSTGAKGAQKSKPSKTLVTFLLDRSGSMQAIQTDTIGAFNAYLAELQKTPKMIDFTFLQFDSQSLDKLYVAEPVNKVSPLDTATFVPRGMTPLIDSAVKTIRAVEASLAERKDQPKIVICFQTDGQENCSREFNWAYLQDLIKEKTTAGWQFIFMGASIDAYQQGSLMGISQANTMSYDSKDSRKTMAAFSATARNTVMFGSGMAMSAGYSGAQKMAAGDVFDPAAGAAAPVGAATNKPARGKKIVDDIKL